MIDEILTELSTFGLINIRRAYGNWTKAGLHGWQSKLLEYAVRPMQQFDYSKGKNATDMAMTVDAMELLYTEKPDAFGIVSSDADFTPLVMHLRAKGAAVYGFGRSRRPGFRQRLLALSVFRCAQGLGDGHCSRHAAIGRSAGGAAAAHAAEEARAVPCACSAAVQKGGGAGLVAAHATRHWCAGRPIVPGTRIRVKRVCGHAGRRKQEARIRHAAAAAEVKAAASTPRSAMSGGG
jgi:uncharacterized protein (TIGR00288 family)